MLTEQERQHIGPVVLRDNGVRSFIPPCFCWELINASGHVVATVSDVEYGIQNLGEADINPTKAEILEGKVKVVGILQNYSVLSAANVSENGVRFLIKEIIEFRGEFRGHHT